MKKAVLVGINDYPNCPLKGCISDATLVSSLLENNGDGSPNFEVRLETNVQSKSELFELINIAFSSDDCTDSLFYFSGHGFLNELGGYIVTPDHKKYDEGISFEDILIKANQSKIKNKTIILDCCHSGAMGEPNLEGKISYLNKGVSILTACRKDEPSYEIDGHGIFTYLLLDALKGGAADLRGFISPGGIYSYIDQSLGSFDQRPMFKTNITRFTCLRQVTPQIPIELMRQLTELFPNPTDDYKLDPSFEFTNDPTYPHSLTKPYAIVKNVETFKKLQKFESVGLIVPIGTEHMYFAAMESKSCKLTALGYHYWRLAKEKRI